MSIDYEALSYHVVPVGGRLGKEETRRRVVQALQTAVAGALGSLEVIQAHRKYLRDQHEIKQKEMDETIRQYQEKATKLRVAEGDLHLAATELTEREVAFGRLEEALRAYINWIDGKDHRHETDADDAKKLWGDIRTAFAHYSGEKQKEEGGVLSSVLRKMGLKK